MIERDDLLDSNLLSRRLVKSRADNTVCALANNILNVILLADVERDLAGTALRRSARHLVWVVWCVLGIKESVAARRGEVVGGEDVVCYAVAQQLGAGATGAEGAMKG